MMFPGEKEAIDAVLRAGEQYGYGNMISRLQDAWGRMLREKYGVGVKPDKPKKKVDKKEKGIK